MRQILAVITLGLALSACASHRPDVKATSAPSADQVALMQAWTARTTWGNKGMGVAAQRAPGYIHVLTTAQPDFRPVVSGPFTLPPALVERTAWQKYCSGQGGLSSPEWSIVNASVSHCRIPTEFQGHCFPTGRTTACGAPGACPMPSRGGAPDVHAAAPAASSASFSVWRAWTRYCGGGALTAIDRAIVSSGSPPAGFGDCRVIR